MKRYLSVLAILCAVVSFNIVSFGATPLQDEWERFWLTDAPSYLTQERIHGGIIIESEQVSVSDDESSNGQKDEETELPNPYYLENNIRYVPEDDSDTIEDETEEEQELDSTDIAEENTDTTSPSQKTEPVPYIVGGRQVYEAKTPVGRQVENVPYVVARAEYEGNKSAIAENEDDSDGEGLDEAVLGMIQIHVSLHDIEGAKELTKFVKDKKTLLEGILEMAENCAEAAAELEQSIMSIQIQRDADIKVSAEEITEIMNGKIDSPDSYRKTALDLLKWGKEILEEMHKK